MNSYLATAAIGKFDDHATTRRTASASTTRSTRRCSSRSPTPTHRDALRDLAARRRLLLQAPACARSPCRPAARRCRSGHARHRAELGLLLRRGAHRRRRRLDDPARRQRPHEQRRRQLVPVRGWIALHPFLAHYQTDNGDGTCTPDGHDRHVVRGDAARATGYEQWTVDLARLRGQAGRGLALLRQRRRRPGARRRSSTTSSSSTGEGSTSFEADGDTLDGWTVPGAPAGSPGNDERLRPSARSPTSRRTSAPWPQRVVRARARDPRLPRGQLRPVPVPRRRRHRRPPPGRRLRAREPDAADLRARSSSTTRSAATASSSTSSPTSGTATASSVHYWADIWLNEGFATYAEWLWSEHEGSGTAQEIFDGNYDDIPADDPFWPLVIGDPGPDAALRRPGLHARRDDAARAAPDGRRRRVLPHPAQVGRACKRGGNGTIGRVHRARRAHLRARSSDALFDAWLFTPAKPAPAPVARRSRARSASAFAQLQRAGRGRTATRATLRR